MSSAAKPNLLFVTAWMPHPTGGGGPMRAYHSLRALSQAYQPHVLVIGVYEGKAPPAPPPEIDAKWARVDLSWRDWDVLRRCLLFELFPSRYYARYDAPSEERFSTDRRVARAARAFQDVNFDLVHVFRLYMTPYARPYVAASPGAATQLDLDEVESSARRRLAELCEINGDGGFARRWRRDAEIYARIEREELPKWGRVLVASEAERNNLRAVVESNRVGVLPNVFPVTPLRPRRQHQAYRFLFVGPLGYVPNADAVRWFIRAAWPSIRQRASRGVALDVVGAGASRALVRELRSAPGVRYWGRVDNLDEVYSEAGAVVVPLRAGGGTRIKVLEAFARGVPVVATAVGVEGLDVVAGRDLLVADSEADFVEACLRLAAEPDLCQSLRESAHRLCQAQYQPQAMADVLVPAARTADTLADR